MQSWLNEMGCAPIWIYICMWITFSTYNNRATVQASEGNWHLRAIALIPSEEKNRETDGIRVWILEKWMMVKGGVHAKNL